ALKNLAIMGGLLALAIMGSGRYSVDNAISGTPPLLQATRTVPIVFPVANDPVGSGYVDSLARPGGNATGFMLFEFSIGGKWLELLKEIAPSVTRAAGLPDVSHRTGTNHSSALPAEE